MAKRRVLVALLLAGCASTPTYDGDYDVKVTTIDTIRCVGTLHLADDAGDWACGTVGGAAFLDERDGELYLTLETAPNYSAQVRSKPGAFIAGPIVLDGETYAFVATRRQ